MKKILILGGSHSELPLIQEAKRRGLYVISVGNILGNGHLESDEYYLIDYSNKEQVLELAKKLNVDYISFGAHDLTITTASYVNDILKLSNLDSYETTCLLHHKDKFKKFTKQNGITTTDFLSLETVTDNINLQYPLIVKPVDMGGGKGISIVENFTQLRGAVELSLKYSKIKKIIVEELFYGKLHSLSVFIVEQKVEFFYVDDEYICKNNPFGVCMSLSLAENFYKIEINILKEIEKVAKILNLVDGLLHIQFLQNGDKYSIIEMTRRMPGDLYNLPVEISTGFAYTKNIINSILFENLELKLNKDKKLISRYCVTYDEIVDANVDVIRKIDIINSIKKEVLVIQYESKKDFNHTLPSFISVNSPFS